MQRILALTRLMPPAYAANMAPPFSLCWPGRGRPIIQRWLGSRKTWMGYGSAIVGAIVGAIAGKLLERRLDCLAMRTGDARAKPVAWDDAG